MGVITQSHLAAPRPTAAAGRLAAVRIALLLCDAQTSQTPFAALDPPADPARHLPEHDWTEIRLAKATAVPQLVRAARDGHDVYVNLCDGAWDEDRAGIEVVQALERLGLPYTGAGPRCYDPSRLAMKMACHSVEVGFPAFVVARAAGDIEGALRRLAFPMIVKHPQGYGSVAMTRDSRVTDRAGLEREVRRIVAAYGAALVEEFVEGREFSVLVAEPRPGERDPLTLTPVEFTFPAGESFKHFEMKWVDYAAMGARAVAEQSLASRLRDAAARMFTALGASGYARVDLRLAADGGLYALEINPNPGAFYPDGAFGSADEILAVDPLGHRGLLQHAIDCARRRHAATRPRWEALFARERGFGMHATGPIAAGDLVERYEERDHRLVTRSHVGRAWSALERDMFERYAWPLTDEVRVIWSDDPERWQPLNHACDPNAWLHGLDLVARRAIAAGEEITVDYATFAGADARAFRCRCGAADCRGTIGGAGEDAAALRERYGEHVSDHVRRASAP